MANWRKTKTPGVYVAHQLRCPAFDNDDARCRCEPSWRGRRHNPGDWQVGVAEARHQGSQRGALVARDREAKRRSRPRAGQGEPDVREHRRRMARRRHGGTHQPPEGAQQAVQRDDPRRLRPRLPQLPAAGVRADAGRRHRRARMADVVRPAQPRGPLTLADLDACRRRVGDLRLGDDADAPLRDEESTPAHRAAAERRAAAPARRVRTRSGAAARRARARGRAALRDRVLRRPPPVGDPSPRMAGRARRPPHRQPTPRDRSKSDAGTERRPPIADPTSRCARARMASARAPVRPARSSNDP